MTETALTDPDYGRKTWEDLVDRTRGVNPNRAQQVSDYISIWQTRLNLMDWEIRYDRGDPNGKKKNYQAVNKYRSTERVSQIRLDPDLPDEQIEGVVVHELLHLVLMPYTTLACTFAARHKQGDLLLDLLHDQEEQMIEVMARALVPEYERWLPYGHLAAMWPAYTR